MTQIKAIETKYSGYKFRSRLEARWAVFFDLLGLKWEYEPEGFDLGGDGWYLPDFRVTSPQGIVFWYEIKPQNAPESEKLKSLQNLYQTQVADEWGGQIIVNQDFVTLCGDPYFILVEQKTKIVCPRCGGLIQTDINIYDSERSIYCTSCDIDTPSGGNHPLKQGLLAEYWLHKGDLYFTDMEFAFACFRVEEFASKARSARFEHGESGYTPPPKLQIEYVERRKQSSDTYNWFKEYQQSKK